MIFKKKRFIVYLSVLVLFVVSVSAVKSIAMNDGLIFQNVDNKSKEDNSVQLDDVKPLLEDVISSEIAQSITNQNESSESSYDVVPMKPVSSIGKNASPNNKYSFGIVVNPVKIVAGSGSSGPYYASTSNGSIVTWSSPTCWGSACSGIGAYSRNGATNITNSFEFFVSVDDSVAPGIYSLQITAHNDEEYIVKEFNVEVL